MKEVGAYEAKTHLPKLLERVQRGERIVITKHGHPIAELIPVGDRNAEKVQEAIDNLQAFRSDHHLGDITIQELIKEGRKY